MCSRTPPGPKSIGIRGAQNHHKTAPPDRCMQVSQDGWRRIPPLSDAAGQNQRAIDEQQQSYEEPYGNNVMSFAHEFLPENVCCMLKKKSTESLPENDLQNHEQ